MGITNIKSAITALSLFSILTCYLASAFYNHESIETKHRVQKILNSINAQPQDQYSFLKISNSYVSNGMKDATEFQKRAAYTLFTSTNTEQFTLEHSLKRLKAAYNNDKNLLQTFKLSPHLVDYQGRGLCFKYIEAKGAFNESCNRETIEKLPFSRIAYYWKSEAGMHDVYTQNSLIYGFVNKIVIGLEYYDNNGDLYIVVISSLNQFSEEHETMGLKASLILRNDYQGLERFNPELVFVKAIQSTNLSEESDLKTIFQVLEDKRSQEKINLGFGLSVNREVWVKVFPLALIFFVGCLQASVSSYYKKLVGLGINRSQLQFSGFKAKLFADDALIIIVAAIVPIAAIFSYWWLATYTPHLYGQTLLGHISTYTSIAILIFIYHFYAMVFLCIKMLYINKTLAAQSIPNSSDEYFTISSCNSMLEEIKLYLPWHIKVLIYLRSKLQALTKCISILLS